MPGLSERTGDAATGSAAAVTLHSEGDRGARYFRADLQIHTPKDPGWPTSEPNDPDERRRVASDYLAAAKKRSIDLVAVTEHHDVSWIDELRHAAQSLDMHLLPGFEVETQEGLHVLCIFDPDKPVVELDDALTILGLDRNRRKDQKLTEIRSKLSLSDVIDAVQDRCGGICVAAHVTSTKGMLNMAKGGARADYWKTPALLAAQLPRRPSEIPKPGLRDIVGNDDGAYRRDRPLAYVLTSDARSEGRIGEQSVWIKMHRPSVAGLRQAFLDSGSRISFDDPTVERSSARLVSVRWDGGYLRDATIALNPELTCLIGGKGTGKSSVIESIRWAFGLDPGTNEAQATVEGLRSFALPAGSQVSVAFESGAPGARRWLVERTAPHAPIVRNSAGHQEPDLAPTDLLEPRIYGQKEVYDVAQSTQARLALVDAFAADTLRDVVERERDLLRALQCSRQDLTAALQDARGASDRLAELPSLLQWRERFRQAGFEERLQERRVLEREGQLLQAAEGALRERQRVLADAAIGMPLAPDLSGGPDANRLPNPDLIRAAREDVQTTVSEVDRALTDAEKAVARGRELLATTREQWAARRAARQADFDSALRELQAQAPDVDPEQYLDVERRIEQLEPLRQTIDQLDERARAGRDERTRLLLDLREARAEKHRRRLDAADRLTTATDGNVRIEIHYQHERGDVLEQLQRLRTKARTDALKRMVDHDEFSPSDFAAKVRNRSLVGAYGLAEGQADLLTRTLDESSLLSLETIELGDGITVSLDVSTTDEPDFRALDRLSPGQKSTAILLLILRSSRDPLLIDQPEDDLDNRFIYDDVVRRLRDAKRERQVVVATHNANIPVLGDAEQIVVLEARADTRPQGFVSTHGTVDDDDVRTAAEQILEGGEEAFQRRREKYGW